MVLERNGGMNMKSSVLSLSPLSLILDHLHISAVDLAAGIHVDPSLISRWRNKNRKFNSSSAHYSNTLNFILDQDERINYQNIAIFLMDYMPEAAITNREEAYKALDLWMSGHFSVSPYETLPPSVDNANVADVGIIKGERQKKEALLYALDTTLMLPERKHLYLMFDDSTDRILEQESFYIPWIQRLHEIIKKGHEISFIYSSDFFRSCIVDLDNFLCLCFSPNFHAYYMPKGAIPAFDLCILEDVLALTNFTPSIGDKKTTLYSFTHPDIVRRLQLQYENQLISCELLVNHDDKKIRQVAITLKGIQHMGQKLSVYDSTPFVFPIRPENFQKILVYNGFSAPEIEAIMMRYLTFIYHPCLSSNFNDCQFLLNMDGIFDALDQYQCIFLPKLLSNKDIVIPKTLYYLYLKEIFDYVSNPESSEINVEIAMVTDSCTGLPRDTTVYAVDNLCAYINTYSTPNEAKHLLFTNPFVAADAYRYLENLRIGLPEENKNMTQLLLILNQMFEKVPSGAAGSDSG